MGRNKTGNNRPTIRWCGPCWIESKRSFAITTRFKLPLCASCLAEFAGNEAAIKKVYAIWDVMPDLDTRPEAWEHFQRVVAAACNTPHPKKQGPITKEENEKICLRKGKQTLEKIRSLLRNPQNLRNAASQPEQTSQT